MRDFSRLTSASRSVTRFFCCCRALSAFSAAALCVTMEASSLSSSASLSSRSLRLYLKSCVSCANCCLVLASSCSRTERRSSTSCVRLLIWFIRCSESATSSCVVSSSGVTVRVGTLLVGDAQNAGGCWIIIRSEQRQTRTFSFCAMRLRMLVGGVGAITMCPAPSLTGVVYALMPVDTPSVGPQAPRKM